MIIAIDGFAGVGKTTVSAEVARKLGFKTLNTGAFFRGIAWKTMMSGGLDTDQLVEIARDTKITFGYRMNETKASRIFVDGKEVSWQLGDQSVADAASKISAIPEIREVVLEMERSAVEDGNYIVEGRDIGTVVFPNAEVKVFLTATPETRARRRAKQWELEGRGKIDLDDLICFIKDRDDRDANRDAAPCVPASDAVLIVTDPLTKEEVAEKVCDLVRQRRSR